MTMYLSIMARVLWFHKHIFIQVFKFCYVIIIFNFEGIVIIRFNLKV